MAIAGKRSGRIGACCLAAFTLFIFLAVTGTFCPTVPYLVFGQLVLAWLGPWITILSVLATILSVRRWRRHHRKRYMCLAGAAGLAALGSTVVVAAQISAIGASGNAVDLLRGLYIGPISHRSAPPEIAVYDRYAEQTLPLAIYRRTDVKPANLAPVLIYVHGGGWISGSYRFRDADMRWFADRGIIVVSVEYALSDAKRHLWDVTQRQIGCAMAWVNANIGRYGGNPAQIAMIGESAGGNLVINAAYMANQGRLHPDCPGNLPHVSAIVSLYPVIDMADFYRSHGDAFTASTQDMAAAYTGGTPQAFPDRYAAVSSIPHISAAAPATIVIVGERDVLVPPRPAYAFAEQARTAGVNIQLIRVPYAGHSFDFLGGSINNQLTRNATLRIMAKQGMPPSDK